MHAANTLIIILGFPRLGPTAASEKIAEALGMRFFQIPESIRKEVREKSEIGLVFDRYMSSGKLVPAKLLYRLIREEIENAGNGSFVINGYPRLPEGLPSFAETFGFQKVIGLRFYIRKLSDNISNEKLDIIRQKTKREDHLAEWIGRNGLLLLHPSDSDLEMVIEELRAMI